MQPVIGIVIPALNPPETLLGMVDKLCSEVVARIVVIDDGSALHFRSLFSELENLEGVIVIHHEENRGKGEALKTGFRYFLACKAVTSIVTVDADGQHLTEDVSRVCSAARLAPDALILGARNFQGDVPIKSAVGNKITRTVLKLTTGLDLKDTQTGLRAVPRPLALRCLTIKSSRYEFELEMLLLSKQMSISINEASIATVYMDRNRATHFRPLRDSFSIYLVFLRFLMFSMMSFCLDISIFALLNHYTGTIFLSTYAARISSGTFNFFCNRHLVFRNSRRGGMTLMRAAISYTALAFLIATASGFFVKTLTELTGHAPVFVKIGVDACLFIVSFVIQRWVIFRPRSEHP